MRIDATSADDLRGSVGSTRSAYGPSARIDDATDEELAARAGAGDRDAMDLLLRRNFDRIHAICRRITCHPEDAKDATQEALISIHRNVASFDGRSTFRTWLYRVATNAALMEVRRRNRRPALLIEGGDRVAGDTAVEPAVRWVDERLDIDAALARLGPELRAAVVLRDLCDLDYPTIAVVLDLPDGTVRSRIHRGRRALGALLQDQRAV